MQSKIPRSSRMSERFNLWALRWGFPALLWLAPRLPRSWNLLGARVVISVVMFLHHRPKRVIAANLARVLGYPPRSRQVRAATREMLFNFAYYWVDLFRFAQLPPERALAHIDHVSGRERLDAARERGKGVILITAHLGNWELGGVLTQGLGMPLSVVYVPDQFAEVERCRQILRRASGVQEIAVRPGEVLTSLPVLRALRENRVVAVQGDRDFDDHGVPLPFFGALARFPRGPFVMAALTGAALVPTFIAYSARHRFELVVEEPILVAANSDRETAVREGMERWVAALERAVRRWPTQWYTFFDYWAPATPREAAAGVTP